MGANAPSERDGDVIRAAPVFSALSNTAALDSFPAHFDVRCRERTKFCSSMASRRPQPQGSLAFSASQRGGAVAG